MPKRLSLILLIIPCFLFGGLAFSQERPPQEETAPVTQPAPLYVRAIIYPTANLSRYDYNNDLDLFEVRAYVVIREGSPVGDFIRDARVVVNATELEWRKNQYEKRIPVPADNLPSQIDLQITTADGRRVSQRFPIPYWLILTQPRPAIIEKIAPLNIAWEVKQGAIPADVYAYDFKRGKWLLRRRHVRENELTLESRRLPDGETILRIYVISSWIFKQYLREENLARGSEINIIPWSQVFIRFAPQRDENNKMR